MRDKGVEARHTPVIEEVLEEGLSGNGSIAPTGLLRGSRVERAQDGLDRQAHGVLAWCSSP
jgi:hypothetical protein